MTSVIRNGHHQGALSAIAAVKPMNEVTAARLQARARDREDHGRDRNRNVKDALQGKLQ